MSRVRIRRHARRPRAARRASAILPLAVVIVLLGMATACGSEDALSQAEYQRELEQTERDIEGAVERGTAELRDLGTGSTTLDTAANAVEEARERLARKADELEEIEPPDGAEDAHAKLVEGFNELARDLGEFEQAIDEGDVARLREFVSDFDELASVRKIEKAKRELEDAGYSLDGGSP